MVGMATFSVARADEKEAKSLLKAMSDYMAAQQAISFDYDANFEVVTKDKQKLALASWVRSLSPGPTRSAPRDPAGLPMSRLFLTERR